VTTRNSFPVLRGASNYQKKKKRGASRGGNQAGWVGSGSDRVGFGQFHLVRLSGHGSSQVGYRVS
jgi:hypothetical protein